QTGAEGVRARARQQDRDCGRLGARTPIAARRSAGVRVSDRGDGLSHRCESDPRECDRGAEGSRGSGAGGDAPARHHAGIRRAGYRPGRAVNSAARRTSTLMVQDSAKIDALVRKAVFGSEDEKAHARWMIWEMGQQAGVRPASIHELYMARGRGETPAFTTPAMNVRIMSYDTGRAIFRAAKRLDAGAIICEIARSEIAYTDQRPAEYVAVMTAAALREGFTGPLFIQGDHVQVNAKKYAADPNAELNALRALIEEEVHAGFYNIDVDSSTLVDLSKSTLDEQQRTNYERAAELTQFIREHEPEHVTVSVGAEIGEVGGKNSDVHELRAFMDGYNRTLQRMGTKPGISKISVQTGTSHGGVVLPDGSIAKVQLDLAALKALSHDACTKYGLGGAVQHG